MGITKYELEKALRDLKDMYEGTRFHGPEGKYYWGDWLCDNEWFFYVVETSLAKELASITGEG